MDNAAKALIIAGGILVALLVISLSMYLYATFRDAYEKNMQIHSAYQINMFNTYFTKYGNDVDVAGSDAYNILSRAYEESNNVDSISGIITVSGKAMKNSEDEFSIDKTNNYYFGKVFYFSESYHWKYHYTYTLNNEGVVNSVKLEWTGESI